VGWAKLWTRLHRYAVCTLRLAALDAKRAGIVEAGDLVGWVLTAGFGGELTWTLPEEATEDQIVSCACTALHGMYSNLRKRDGRSCGDDALAQLAHGAPDAVAMLLERSVIEDAKRALAPDAEASACLALMLEGERRPEIMAKLGLDEKHADVVKRRILRTLKALGAATNDNREDEPPSSGPRGGYHDLQATEERQRAAPEPHRGALRAGRRR
jgi:hypothetical protein